MGTSQRILKVTEGGGTPGEIQFGANGYVVTMKGNSALAADTTITLPDIIADVHYNVKDYGADETGVTECGTEIQAAINAAEVGGGTVYFPPGTYLVQLRTTLGTNQGLLIDSSNVKLKGAPGARIKFDDDPGTGHVLIRIKGGVTDIQIENLILDGKGDSYTGGASSSQSHLISLTDCERVKINNNYFYKSAGDFISTYDTSSAYPSQIIISDNYMEECRRNGITCMGSYVLVKGNIINGFNTDGIVIEPDNDFDCKHVHIIDNVLIPNATKLLTTNGDRLYAIALHGGQAGAMSDTSRSDIIVKGNSVLGVYDTDTRTGTTSIGSAVVTNMDTTTTTGLSQYVKVGHVVTGVGIPQGTRILTVDVVDASVGQITLSKNATAAGARSLEVGSFWPNNGVYINEFKSVVIDGNSFRKCSSGIVSASLQARISIVGNQISDCLSLGIDAWRACNVIGNMVERCGDCGIRLYRDHNNATGNVCLNNGRLVSSNNLPYGIWTEYSQGIISCNTCTNSPFIRQGDIENGSAVVSNIDTTLLMEGESIAGTGIPGGTTILTIDSQTQLTMDANASATTTSLDITITSTSQTHGVALDNTAQCIDNLAINNMVDGNATAGVLVPGTLRNNILRGNYGYDRHIISGNLEWGDGTNAPDVTLYRSAANVLKTDDAFTCSGILTVTTGGASITGDTTVTGKHFVDQDASANGVEVDHDGDTGYAIYAINKSGNTDECLRIVSNGAEAMHIGCTSGAAAVTAKIEQGANNYSVLQLTKTGTGSGPMMYFENSGTGVDILGHNSNWHITKEGYVRLGSASGDPTPSSGLIYLNTTSGKLKFYTGSGWETITST